jgi:hypothetical protein
MDDAAIHRQARLEAARLTLQQARKYPETVNLSAVRQARDYIRAVETLNAQMTRSTPQTPQPETQTA